jgi:hypothetical protein
MIQKKGPRRRPTAQGSSNPTLQTMERTSMHKISKSREPRESRSAEMTRADRLELCKVVRQRARVLQADAKRRQAAQLADVERQLSDKFSISHQAWEKITAEAQAHIEAVVAAIATKCAEMGVDQNLRPHIGLSWFSRGENAEASRRSELRKAAQTKIESDAQNYRFQIEKWAADFLMRLSAGALRSSEAQAFLTSIPDLEALMPVLSIDTLEKKAALEDGINPEAQP